MNPDKHGHRPIETLRISDRDKQKLVNTVNESSGKQVDRERRALRVQYTEAKAVLTLHVESGGSTRLAVVPRNLSRRGLAFVHGRFIYTGTRCEVMLKTLADEWVAIQGVVRNCRHISGIVHEIAVVFDEAIDLSDFVRLSSEEEMIHLQELAADLPESAAEAVKQVAGSVLVVDDFPTDRKLFGLWLSRAGFEAKPASDAKEARRHIDEDNYDLAVIDLRLGGEDGLALIRTLRACGFSAPIIAVSASDAPDLEADATSAGASMFLGKPFTADQLLDATETLLGVDLSNEANQQPIYSTISDDEEMKPLLTEFVRGLGGYIHKLKTANAHNDLETLEGILHVLKGAGSGYGYDAITEQAGATIKSLRSEDDGLEKAKQQVNALIRVLNRVKL